MSLPVRIPTPKPPAPHDDYAGLEDLDRPELDDADRDTEPDTERDPRPRLPTLDWDEADGESGVKRRDSDTPSDTPTARTS